MAIGKIVFTPLSTLSLPYTAIGGIRFYDENNHVINTIGSGVITNTLTRFESSVIIATVDDTWHNGDNYYIGNAVRTDRPQAGIFGCKCYWLSGKDNQTITITFKTPIKKISKIQFAPKPDKKYRNRGIDRPFKIKVYDQFDNLIISYNVKPTNNFGAVQTIKTPELLNLKTYLVLFAKPDNTVWYYDKSNSIWKQINTLSTLTETDFQNYGMSLPLSLDKNTLSQLTLNSKLLIWTDDTSVKSGDVFIKYLPFDQLIVQNKLLNLKGYEQINSITVNRNILGTANIKVVISKDLTNWYAWNGTSWTLVKSGNLDYTNPDDVNLILTNGMDVSTLNSLTWNEFQELYKDESGNIVLDYIAFAFALSLNDKLDVAEILSVVINATPKSMWKDVTSQCEILQGYSTIQVTFNLAGDFKVNYIDGSAISTSSTSTTTTTTTTLTEIDGGNAIG